MHDDDATRQAMSPLVIVGCVGAVGVVRLDTRGTIRGRLHPGCNDGVVKLSSDRLPHPSHVRRRAAALSTALLFVAGALSSVGLASMQTAEAATSGWYIATVPGTGTDDVLLGSTCANALQCWSVGITWRTSLALGSRLPTPLVEAWNGTTWTFVPTAIARRGGWGALRRHLRQRFRLLGGRRLWSIGEWESNRHSRRAMERHVVVHGAESDPQWTGCGGRRPLERQLRVDIQLHGGRLCDGRQAGNNLTDVTSSGMGRAGPSFPRHATGQAFDQLISVQCLSTADCWAVGNAGPAAQTSGFLPIFPGAVGDQGLIEHWDGSAWSIVPSTIEPLPSGGYLSGLECVGDTDCWASGATTDT